jgi:CRP-like cAMP-binding protein
MSVFLQAANAVVLLSFLARDILWLRMLSILAGLLFIAFYLALAQPIWSGTAWNVLFICINIGHIARIVRERRPIQLSQAELRLQRLGFASLAPQDLRRLVGCGEWVEHPPETLLITQGQSNCRLMVITKGRAGIRQEGGSLNELGHGHLIGEVSWVTGNPPKADVIVLESLQCLVWDPEKLAPVLEKYPTIHQALQVIVGQDLARKLAG